jgi:hypothetical protein
MCGGPIGAHGLEGSVGELEAFGEECWIFFLEHSPWDLFWMDMHTLELDIF